MEVTTLSKILFSLGFLFVTGWVWKVIDWVWFRPKKLEKFLISNGFSGRPYKFFYGNKKDIGVMVKESNSKPMDRFSNDYVPRVLPFHFQTIKDYGEVSYIWNGPKPTIIITRPKMMREIMMKIYEYEKPILHPFMKKLSNGLVRLEGPKWARDRKLLNPAFHMHKLKHMLGAFQMSCKEMVSEWEEMMKSNKEIEIWTSLHNMSADAISRAAFGSCFDEGKLVFELLREHVSIIVHVAGSVYIPGSRFLPTKTNNRVSKITKEVETQLKNMIDNRQREIEDGEEAKDDLLGILLQSYNQGIQDKSQPNNNIKLTLKQVIEECKMFYVAGQETTSALLVWTLILLSKHQGWQQLARQEVILKFGHNLPNFDGLNDLKTVNMILHEVLRLYPPISFVSRKVNQDIKLGDILLPKGVLINLPLSYVQQDEELWGSDAKEFKPERFSQGILKATQGNMSFFSFGWGPRNCIGSNFAMLEAKSTLAMILQRFTFELSPSYSHAPSLSFGTLRPQFGAKLIFHHI